jgi:hypothetical protein
MARLWRWSAPIHDNGELSHSLSKKGLRIRILKKWVLPMPVPVPVLIAIVVLVRDGIEVDGVILERRGVS